MKKAIYLAAFAALALTACSNDSDSVFDKSAAERLEQYKKEYADVLTADGGLWTMEYFSNEEEPGYLFVMKFNTDGSVKIAANHKWIGSEYKEETSLWKMIADNGPVLTFNSYNTLFHIFSDPANITGPDAPKSDDGKDDVNETGYGHEGDYEFQVMDVSEDGQTVRLLGKKRLYHIYLRRLDASTDIRAYMDDYQEMSSSLFARETPYLIFNDADGDRYVVTDAHTGIMSLYPADGDPVDQTRKGNFIITNTGIRFLKPLEIVDAAGNEKEISEFRFVGNRSLASVDNENSIISAGTVTEILYNNVASWKVDLKSVSGSISDCLDGLNEQLKDLYNYKSAALNEMSFDFDVAEDTYILRFNFRISSKSYETDRFYVTFGEDGGKLKINIGEPVDNNSQLALNAYTKLSELFSLLSSSPVSYSTVSDCGPKTMVLDINGGGLTMTAVK